jgi:uncharacterized protein YlxP (DUF503 family)
MAGEDSAGIMSVGILKIVLFFSQSNSLKSKRMILHSLKANLRNRFNLAITQTADEDKWQKATLAIVGVERYQDKMHRVLAQTVNFIAGFSGVQLIDYEMEML